MKKLLTILLTFAMIFSICTGAITLDNAESVTEAKMKEQFAEVQNETSLDIPIEDGYYGKLVYYNNFEEDSGFSVGESVVSEENRNLFTYKDTDYVGTMKMGSGGVNSAMTIVKLANGTSGSNQALEIIPPSANSYPQLYFNSGYMEKKGIFTFMADIRSKSQNINVNFGWVQNGNGRNDITIGTASASKWTVASREYRLVTRHDAMAQGATQTSGVWSKDPAFSLGASGMFFTHVPSGATAENYTYYIDNIRIYFKEYPEYVMSAVDGSTYSFGFGKALNMEKTVVNLGNTEAIVTLDAETGKVSVKSSGYAGVVTINAVFTDGKSETKVVRLYSGNKWKPGLNVYTGTKEPVDFDKVSQTDYNKIFTGTAKLAANPDKKGNDSDVIAYVQTAYNYIYSGANLTTPIELERTVNYSFDVKGNRPSYLVINGSGGNNLYSSPGAASSWVNKNYNINLANSKGSMKGDTWGSGIKGIGIGGQSGTYGYQATNYIYYDNFSLIPYYKATYMNNEGTEVYYTEYFLKGTDGKILTAYTPFDKDTLSLEWDGEGEKKFIGWSTEKNAAVPMTSITLEHKDIVLYPVWETEPELIPVTLTVYFDKEKTESKTYNLYAGDSLKLPDSYEIGEYAPDGYFAKAIEIDGKIYAPGKTIEVPVVEELVAVVQYESLLHSEYGNLVFFESFDGIKDGTFIYNPNTEIKTPLAISFINPIWSTNKSHFEVQLGDSGNYIYVTDDGTGNNVLKIQKTSTEQLWPQVCIFNKDVTPDGYYTFVADFGVPAEQAAGISNFNLRTFYTSSKYESTGKSISASDDGKWIKVALPIHIKAGSAHEAIYKFQLYITSKATHENTFYYVDNIALYVKNNSLTVKVSDTKSNQIFFADGGMITFPYAYDIYDSIPDGYTLSHFKCGNLKVMPGEVYTANATDEGKVFEAVYKEEQFGLKFDLGSMNGTVSEIPVMDGETIILPQSAGVTGWEAYGSCEVYKPGDRFTFVRTDEIANLDGMNRLVFTAVYENATENTASFRYNYKLNDGMFEGATTEELTYIKLAYGAGIIPVADIFNADASVTLAELIKVAERLYYRSQNKASDFDTDSERLMDMSGKGVCPEYESLDIQATFADVAIVLANSLSDNFYSEIAYDVNVSGLAYGDEGYAEALKLIRSGILPESTDFTNEITYGELVKAVARTVQPSERTVENKRTLYILGDSLTAKTGTIGWPTKIEPFLDGNLEVVNHGIGGINTRTYHTLGGSTGAGYLYVDMLQKIKHGDYVVVALGTNDSTLWENGSMTYEESRDNYLKYIKQIRSQGGIPILVCPVGRNKTVNGVYVESDPLIIECMNDVNEIYGVNAPIINFKDVSFERLGAMTAAERLKIYADNVHYTSYGAEVVAGWFAELTLSSSDILLSGLANHFEKKSFDFETQDKIYSFETPETDKLTSIRTVSPAGIRFRANIGNAVRDISDDVAEYGFIVTRSELLYDKNLTHNSDVLYVSGAAYNNVTKKDIIYNVDSEIGDIMFTAVLTNIPETKEGFMTTFVVRSYVKVGSSYFYGDVHSDSVYEAAKRYGETDNEYIKNIIRICEE